MNQTKIPNVEKVKKEVIDVQIIQIIPNLDVIQILTGVLIIICMVFDVKTHKIPNLFLVSFLVLAVAAMTAEHHMEVGIERVLVMAALLTFFYPIFCIRMIGAGDVKLLAVLVLYMPGAKVIYFLFYGFFLAGCGALFKMLCHNNIGQRLGCLRDYFRDSIRLGSLKAYYEKQQGNDNTIPMAVPIGISFLLYMGGMY